MSAFLFRLLDDLGTIHNREEILGQLQLQENYPRNQMYLNKVHNRRPIYEIEVLL